MGAMGAPNVETDGRQAHRGAEMSGERGVSVTRLAERLGEHRLGKMERVDARVGVACSHVLPQRLFNGHPGTPKRVSEWKRGTPTWSRVTPSRAPSNALA